jgi:DNA ligase (NAD+)
MPLNTDKRKTAKAATRVAILTDQLLRLQHEYYVLTAPTASDGEYDSLFDELVRIETEFPRLRLEDSPTQRVGSDLSQDLPEVEHRIPVLSLDKAYTVDELLRWAKKLSKNADEPAAFAVEEKIDGTSIVLYYAAGTLRRAVTRGNGHVGNDVTANVRTIRSVPLRISSTASIAVRGEIYITRDDFAKMNAGGAAQYANPRNFASGAVRRVKSSAVASIPLRLFVYDLTFLDETNPLDTHSESIETLHEWGFPVNPRSALFSPATVQPEVAERRSSWDVYPLAELPAWVEQAEGTRPTLNYEIDGLVAKVDDLATRELLGFTGHHPRWALALKFDAPQGETTLLGVDVQIGRTGRVTPVARVEPVLIAGSTIANVTLHNQDYIDALELAMGDRVAVSKRGDVIPAVERVLEKNEAGNTTWRSPRTCPTCRRKLRRLGAHLFCVNQRCPDQVRGRIRFFAARGQMDIENLGAETIDLLIARKLVRDVDQIYTFDVDALLDIDGFGPKKTALIRRGIDASRKRPFATLLAALGMPEIGPKVVELLIEAGYTDIERWFDVAQRVAAEADAAVAADTQARGEESALDELTAIDGIGEKTALTLVAELNAPTNRERIDRLRAAGLRFSVDEPAAATNLAQTFAAQTWCITGGFTGYESREVAAAAIKQRGGRVVGAVTARCTHLLAGRGGGSKRERAAALGVTIVDEDTFTRLLADTSDLPAVSASAPARRA